ncbi:hypothetical protein [Parvularcula sp. LCG005]|uniref:hypothetical protein n=1 Tax=Parvularcula sp. LCG005 TaxID=3078805 RepID=UPI0029438F11|nr:hypothetical protein [Parvularcula sp. LCG005]WOI53534.1 hypothetical protein RUI03_00735 [Parvularcula sp. LCG005]
MTTSETAPIDRFDPNDEPLPFLNNFQDVFLSIGVIVFLVGIMILMTMTSSSIANETSAITAMAVMCAVVLAIVWWLSEILVRRRRRILPGIVLFIAFVQLCIGLYGSGFALIFGEETVSQFENGEYPGFDESVFEGAEPTDKNFRAAANMAVAAIPLMAKIFMLGLPLATLLASYFYYRRFKLPFSVAGVATAAIGLLIVSLFFAFPYDVVRFAPVVLLSSGLALLVAGIVYDMKDPERVTRFSGNGFWLHLFAAPLTLWGAMTISTQGLIVDFPALAEGNFTDFKNPFTVQQSIVTLCIIAVFGVISLLLNRRALVVSGLVTAGIAIGVIVQATGIGGAGVAAVTMICLGGGILLLGIGWNAARRALLSMVPSAGIWGRVFPRNEVDG